ncbi:glycosyltransferase family 39 protein [bacterium]|nr:MAG: glycosyltransferase family 39 protein [bacterium]
MDTSKAEISLFGCRDTRTFLIVIFAVGFVLRMTASLYVDQVLGGAYGFRDFAENLINGDGYFWRYTNNKEVLIQNLITFRPPLYTFFYTGMLFLFGDHSFLFIMVQSIIGATLPVLIFLIGRYVWDSKTASIAAVIACVYPHFLTRAGNVSDDNLFMPFLCLGILFLLRSLKTSTFYDTFFSALFIGLSLMTRQTIILFIPLIVLYLLFQNRRRHFIHTSFFAAISFFMLLPWLIFHYSKYDNLSLSDATGRTIWTGNNQFTYDPSIFPDLSVDKIERRMFSLIPKADVEELKHKNTVEQDRYFMENAIKFIREHPLDFAKSLYYKNLGLFGFTYNPKTEYTADKNSQLRQWIHTLSYVPLLLLGLIGLGVNIGKRNHSFIFILLIISFVLISWLFWSHTRHAIPYHMVWILFSADVISRISLRVFPTNRFQ